MRKTVGASCTSCGATGLYSGMCEGKGKAVVCLDCNGTGCQAITYTPFRRRKRRRDIKTVILGRESKSILEDSTGEEISYKEWVERTEHR